MATILNNPGSTERVVEKSDSGGWAVAVIILLAVVVIGGFVWMRYYGAPAPANTDSNTPGSANINITLPADNGDDTGASGSGEATTPNPAQ
jgi:hypothetical protein